jgi:replicative DNA helicase
VIGAGELTDLNSPEFMKAFAEEQQQETVAVPTPFEMLNRALRDAGGGVGLAPSWMCIIGANPGHTKSVLALNFAAKAIEHGQAVGFANLEMSKTQVASRFYAIQSGLPVAAMERGTFSPRIFETVEASRELPAIYTPRTVSTNYTDVVDFVAECHGERGVSFFVVDYVQLCAIAGASGSDSVVEAVSNVTLDLREWAVNNNAIILLLSQFNRTTSANYKDTPRSQGLYGSMVLESSADVCLLVDHSKVIRSPEGSGSFRSYLVCDKNRHGPSQFDIPFEVSMGTLRARQGMPDEIDQYWPKP